MDAHFHAEFLRVTQSLRMHVALNAAGEVSHSDGVMAAQETIIDVFLDDFETTAGHIRLTHSLDLLEAMLLAK